MRIKNADKRASRVNWLLQLYECWDYFRKDIGYDKLPTKIQVDEIISQNGLNFLKGDGDQIIVAEAIYYGCDSILHMDYKTISSRKKELTEIGITPYTPSEYCHKFGYIQRDFLREL